MAVTSWIRRQFKNGVTTTAVIPSGCSSGATSFTVGSGQGTTFPDGSVGDFIVTLDQGAAAEEKVLCASRSADTFTVAANGRGYNGTTAQAHGTNATVLHTMDAQDLDEANQVAVQTLGAITTSGDLLVGASANTLSRLARGAANSFLQVVGSTLAYTGFGVGQSTTVAGSNTDGTQTTPARSDHGHQGVASFNGRNNVVTPGNADYLAVPTGGLTGAVAATRFVGATAAGAPTSGTFAVGDFIVDQAGFFWVCTAAGTPGTWAQIPNLATSSLQSFTGPISSNRVSAFIAGVNGRWTGQTATGGAAPTGFTAAVGDIATDPNGAVWVCTAAGNPGTWRLAGLTGTLGSANQTSNQGSITSATDLTGLTTTVTVVTGRRIKITAQIQMNSTVSTDVGTLLIVEGSTVLQQSNVQANNGTAVAITHLTPTAGSHTYKLQAARSGTGTLTMQAGATFPAFILVEDIGT